MFKNPDELSKFNTERREADRQRRWRLAQDIGQAQCYYIGMQWISLGGPWITQNPTAGTTRLVTNWNPDSKRLRATVNRVTKHVIKEAAATHPSEIEIDVTPSSAAYGIDAAVQAETIEKLAGYSIDTSGFVERAQLANFMRSMCGLWGMGLYVANRIRDIDGQQVADKTVHAFDFDPVRLILDPAKSERNLEDHEEVVYEDVWTTAKIRRIYGDIPGFRDEDCHTVGQLLSGELEINRLSQDRLYQHYRIHSNSKGARVCQTHVKDQTGRFGLWYVSIQYGGDYKCVNFENPVSQFGGSGLPLTLLHGHRRPGSICSIGAGQMTKDDQDRINLFWSQVFRQNQASGTPKIVVDRRSFPRDTTEEAIANRITNEVGGVMVIEQRADKGIPPPHVLAMPPPQPVLQDMARSFEDDMRQQVFRAEGHFGLGAKSHVPYQTTNRLLEEADQVLGIRVQDDTKTYARMLSVLVSTNISLVQSRNPTTLATLRECGFDEDDFGVILQTDAKYPGYSIKIRESSVRYRPPAVREGELNAGVTAQMITPSQYRMSKAEDLQAPLFDRDKQMLVEINRAVRSVLMGATWQPLPLGEYNEMAGIQLRKALFDPIAKKDPAARQRVLDAILLQTQAEGHEMALKQSALMEAQAATQQQAQPPAPGQEQDQPETIEDLLNQLGGGQGGGVPQPTAA